MFHENLKNLRNKKGLSQEELAERLHVVRQTISKWEKGLSVPDADSLIRIADFFETSVNTLLGETVESESSEAMNVIAQKLEQLNALLAEKNRRSRRIWKVVAVVLIVIAAFVIVLVVSNIATFHDYSSNPGITQATAQVVVP